MTCPTDTVLLSVTCAPFLSAPHSDGSVSRPTSCLRSTRGVSLRSNDLLPTKSGFTRAMVRLPTFCSLSNGPISFLTDDDRSLGQRVTRVFLGAITGNAGLPQQIPRRMARESAGRLISNPHSPVKLTRNNRMENCTKKLPFTHAHMWHRREMPNMFCQWSQRLRRARSLQRDHRPIVR